MSAPNGMWECPNCGDYVDSSSEFCPNCDAKKASVHPTNAANSTSTEEVEQIVEPIISAQARDSSAAVFLKIIAWILWIGGLILTIVNSVNGASDRYGDPCFSWKIFFTGIITYTVYGGFAMCAAELFENIQIIANALQGFNITRSKGKDK